MGRSSFALAEKNSQDFLTSQLSDQRFDPSELYLFYQIQDYTSIYSTYDDRSSSGSFTNSWEHTYLSEVKICKSFQIRTFPHSSDLSFHTITRFENYKDT